MTVTYKLYKTFGPVGSVAGIILFAAGFILVWFSLSAFVLIILGAFIGFSYSSTEIDFEQKKIRYSDVLFGIIRIGKWINVEPEMKIGILKSRKTWVTYSLGNRTLESPVEDYRLELFKSSGIKIMLIKKVGSSGAAGKDQEEICEKLQISKL
jgi:hypothetical protein